ncbi:unnamed protein product [Psylliodes chrysocephalus]|uniref:Uncharacterized protein n=1 Tax=Psylliodes chrysocephalus TaxID=3402493 RepID=A0A9P0CLS4_9CUCU|nr:unnamed protein product [Psylliodes chrysocephala]
MSIRERLKISYENVGFSADNTWSKEFNSYQQTNMDLLMREKGLIEPKSLELRPRTVRDCIPNSKLAKYSNYEYNDSRELSYTLDDFKPPINYEYNFAGEIEKEPWMLEEVNRFFKLYTEFYKSLVDTKEDQNRLKFVSGFESPFLKCNSLSEYFLKLQVTKDSIKKLWDPESIDSRTFMFRSLHSIRGEKSLLVYKSPAGSVFVSEYDDVSSELKEDYYEWYKNDFDQNNMDRLNLFSSSLKQIPKENTIDNQILENQTDAAQNRRLYSAVLQGFSSNKIAPTPTDNQMTILRRNFSKTEESVMKKIGNVNNFSKRKVDSDETGKNPLFVNNIPKLFPNKSITSSRSVQTATSASEVGIDSSLNSQCEKICQVNPISQSQSTYFPLSQVVSQQPMMRYRQNFAPNNYQYPSFYMFVHNSFQQNYLQPFYNPMLLQRTVPINLERNVLQRNCQSHVPSHYNVASSFISQNQFSTNFQKFDNQLFKNKSRTKTDLQKKSFIRSRRNLSLDDIKKPSETLSFSNLTSRSDCSISEVNNEMDELVSKTVNLVLEDSKIDSIVPITGSQSDELERQALEQYTNSSDNVFQDLERQAAEEYEDNSENYLGPPNYEILFGGFLKQMKYCIS